MDTAVDPLARLVVDDATIDRELLAKLLEGRVVLDPKKGVFAFRRDIRDELTKRQLILIALLAQEALHLLAGHNSKGLRPQEIEALTGVSGNTLRPMLKGLADDGITRRDDSGAHFVVSYGLELAARLLNQRG